MSGSTISVTNQKGQSIDTIYTGAGTKKIKLAVGNVDVATDTEDAAWQGAASHVDGATFVTSDGVSVGAGVDSATQLVHKLLVDALGQLQVVARVPSGNLTDGSGTIAVGATAQQIFAANASRQYFFFQNNSDTDMWINFGTAAVASQPSIKVEAGLSLEPAGFMSTQLISVLCATSGKTFTAKQA